MALSLGPTKAVTKSQQEAEVHAKQRPKPLNSPPVFPPPRSKTHICNANVGGGAAADTDHEDLASLP